MPNSVPQRRAIGELADTNPETLGVGADPRAQFKYVDLSSVKSGTIDWNSAPQVTLLTAPSRARRVLRHGDVLFGTVRPNLQSHGYVDWAGTSALVGSTGFSVIRSKAGISDPRYLFHCVMSSGVTAQANRDAVGSSYPALNDSDVRRFEVFAPPIEEQLAVAQILDTLDTTIRQTEAIIEKLKQVKQGLLHDLLTRGIDANGELRPPQNQAPHLYKHSPLGWIPREWETAPLSNWIELVAGQHIDASACNAVGKGVPYFTGPSDFSGTTTVVTNYTSQPLVMCEEGDLLVTVKGSGCGKVAQASVAACISRQLMAIRVAKATRSFWLQVLHVHSGVLNRMAEGGNIPGLNRRQLLDLMVAAPESEAEMVSIARLIGILDARVSSEQLAREKLQTMKSGLMDDLLTGRVRVTSLLKATP